MDTVIQRFRTALNGFNRRDVQQYIEQTAAAHKRETDELKVLLAGAEERRDALEKEISELRDERGAAVAEEARVRESLESSTRSLTRLRGEQTEAESKLAVARQELSRLSAQVEELQPMAASYAQLKDLVATVELEAHKKAKSIVEAAQAEADGIRADTKRWLSDVLAGYGSLRRGMDGMAAQFSAAAEQAPALDEQARLLRERGELE